MGGCLLSIADERQSLEVVIEDNHGQSQTLAFDFNSKDSAPGQPTFYLASDHHRPAIVGWKFASEKK